MRSSISLLVIVGFAFNVGVLTAQGEEISSPVTLELEMQWIVPRKREPFWGVGLVFRNNSSRPASLYTPTADDVFVCHMYDDRGEQIWVHQPDVLSFSSQGMVNDELWMDLPSGGKESVPMYGISFDGAVTQMAKSKNRSRIVSLVGCIRRIAATPKPWEKYPHIPPLMPLRGKHRDEIKRIIALRAALPVERPSNPRGILIESAPLQVVIHEDGSISPYRETTRRASELFQVRVDRERWGVVVPESGAALEAELSQGGRHWVTELRTSPAGAALAPFRPGMSEAALPLRPHHVFSSRPFGTQWCIRSGPDKPILIHKKEPEPVRPVRRPPGGPLTQLEKQSGRAG